MTQTTLTGGGGDLAGYERAARAMFTPMGELVARRRSRAAAGTSPFDVDAEEQISDLAVWAAGACYLLADATVKFDPVTRSAVTAPSLMSQAIQYYSSIEQWLVSASSAPGGYRRTPSFPTDAPALLAPAAPDVAFAAAVVTGLTSLLNQLAGDIATLRRLAPAEAARLAPVDEAIARCTTIAGYATNLLGPGLSTQALARIVDQVAPAINLAFRVGQVVAAPSLLDDAADALSADAVGTSPPPTTTPGVTTRPFPLDAQPGSAAWAGRPAMPATGIVKHWAAPGAPGFDPFCLSDPHSRLMLDTHDNRGVLYTFWQRSGGASLVRLQNLIEEALASGDVVPLVLAHGRYAPPHQRCPWSAVYEVSRPIQLAGTALVRGDNFTLGLGPLDPADATPVILVDTFSVNAEGRSAGARPRALPRPEPGSPDFDPWLVTDPRARPRLARDPQRLAELDALWSADPDHGATTALLDELEAAVLSGLVQIAQREGTGAWIGSHAQCPWPPICMTTAAMTLAGIDIAAGRQFVIRFAFEAGAPAVRTVALGPFTDADLLATPGQPATVASATPVAPPAAEQSASASASASAPAPAPAPAVTTPAPPLIARHGAPNFDPWCATDVHSRGVLRSGGGATALDAFWSATTAADALIDVVEQVLAAIGRGDAAYASDDRGAWLGHLADVPWAPLLVARHDVPLAGTEVTAGQQFAWSASAGGGAPGIVLGPFTASPTGWAVAAPPPPAAAAFDLERDRWRLTDPHARGRLRGDPRSRREIDAYWGLDPDPNATLAAMVLIEAAIVQGDLAYQTTAGGAWVGPVDEVPWPACLRATGPLHLLDTDVAAGDVVSFLPRTESGAFVRTLLRVRAQPQA